jgi:hypothetical protein
MSRQRILDRTVLKGPRYDSPVPIYGNACSACGVVIEPEEPVVVTADVGDPVTYGTKDDPRRDDPVRYLKLHRSCAVLFGVIP